MKSRFALCFLFSLIAVEASWSSGSETEPQYDYTLFTVESGASTPEQINIPPIPQVSSFLFDPNDDVHTLFPPITQPSSPVSTSPIVSAAINSESNTVDASQQALAGNESPWRLAQVADYNVRGQDYERYTEMSQGPNNEPSESELCQLSSQHSSDYEFYSSPTSGSLLTRGQAIQKNLFAHAIPVVLPDESLLSRIPTDRKFRPRYGLLGSLPGDTFHSKYFVFPFEDVWTPPILVEAHSATPPSSQAYVAETPPSNSKGRKRCAHGSLTVKVKPRYIERCERALMQFNIEMSTITAPLTRSSPLTELNMGEHISDEVLRGFEVAFYGPFVNLVRNCPEHYQVPAMCLSLARSEDFYKFNVLYSASRYWEISSETNEKALIRSMILLPVIAPEAIAFFSEKGPNNIFFFNHVTPSRVFIGKFHFEQVIEVLSSLFKSGVSKSHIPNFSSHWILKELYSILKRENFPVDFALIQYLLNIIPVLMELPYNDAVSKFVLDFLNDYCTFFKTGNTFFNEWDLGRVNDLLKFALRHGMHASVCILFKNFTLERKSNVEFIPLREVTCKPLTSCVMQVNIEKSESGQKMSLLLPVNSL